ncbi:hypothetical protein BDZ97DRAFT_636030 [Flammula alnicola]|nr:hypothetical protein BDZ97DRAFT_636030 [Flammula alnicola]
MEEREFGRRPGQAPSIASDSTTTVSAAPAQSTTATSAVIIPNKSTMEEEHIDIPYGREGHDSGVTTIDDRAGDTGRDIDGDTEPPDSASEYANPTMPRNPPAGRMGLSARLKGAEDDDDAVPGNRSGDNLYDKYGRSSVDSTRSAGGNGMGSRLINGRVSTSEDTEKMRRDYEYKIATMQTQVTTLERDLDDAAENEKRRKESEARVRQLDEELAGLLQRAEEQSLAMRSMQKELEDLKEARQREARQAQDDREELIIFRDRCNKLEEENELRQGAADSENVDQLRSAMEDLVMEISELSRRNDELMTSKESDNVLIRDMDNQLKEYKRKYEQAKTELRSPLITDDLFSLCVDEWNAHFANMAKSTEPTFTDNAPKQVVTVPELPCVTSSTTNIQPTYNTAATMPAKDWDLSNLLLAQMGYVQTNPGSNFNQQFDTPIPSYIPGTTMPQMGTGNTAYATTPKIVNSGYAPAVKATSQLFLQAPKFDRGEDQLPMAPDGGVLDIHITAFLSAVDSFLTAGRSNALTRVLTPMKSVINVVTNIIEDVKAFERRPVRDRADVDADSLRSLRDRAEATLSNLVAATKIHASSSGMSPVSLLDAAASHVSVTITEIGRTICIRKATKAEQEQYAYTTYAGPPASALDGFSPSLRSVEETRSGHQRKASQASPSSRGGQFFFKSPSSPLNNQSWSYMDNRRRPPSDNSSSVQTNSPPPIFDTHSNLESVMSDDSVQAEGPEDAWAELKPYLEAQTESIVYAIQSALSGVRSPTPSPTLNENLTQIITIVSSIVAVCNDNLPPASAQQGNEILRELSDHANKLSEVQALPEVTKESRQIMAKSSFAIANAMKGLMKL